MRPVPKQCCTVCEVYFYASPKQLAKGYGKFCSTKCYADSMRGIPKDSTATHRMTGSREYITWVSMKARCYRKDDEQYKNYGGRGIKVCDRWVNSFENFFRDMGIKPPGSSIDRVNVSGDYEPENCRWANWHQQAANRRGRNESVGVWFDKENKSWRAGIKVKGKSVTKRFKDKKQAIIFREKLLEDFGIKV